MQDGKALQMGTSHYLGDNFAKAYDITYLSKDGKLEYCYTTSWGTSTRMIGGVIMVHGDDRGLVLPPKVAPIQVVIIPVAQHKPGVLDKADELFNELKATGIRVKVDDTDQSVGWKFNEYEMKGVPLRLEVGPKDIENNKCVFVRRDTREKYFVSLDELETKLQEILDTMQEDMLSRAKTFLKEHVSDAHNYEEFKEIAETKPGFIRGMWCESLDCELKIKEDTTVTSRCMPFDDQEQISDVCVCCGKPAHKLVYWGKAY